MKPSTYDICKNIIEKAPPSVWKKCINVLYQTLKNNPSIGQSTIKIPVETFNQSRHKKNKHRKHSKKHYKYK